MRSVTRLVLTGLPFSALGQAAGPAAGQPAPNAQPQDTANRPIAKVIKLLTEMKETAEKEQKTDAELYEKMDCWCTTNKGEKDAAVEAAQEKIADLEAAIEGYTAKAAQLDTEIKGLTKDIAKNKDAFSEATALREKENAAFQKEKAELEETIDALTRAVSALGKAHGGGAPAEEEEAGTALIQVKNVLSKQSHNFQDLMRKDLWDVLGSINTDNASSSANSAMLNEMFLAPSDNKALLQQPSGGVAGAKSYASQSGAIFGILQQMEEDFKKKLSDAENSEAAAEQTFQDMKAALLREIVAQEKSLASKKQQLADTNDKNAQAKQDVEDTTAALTADQKFLVGLEKKCATADKDFQARTQTRADEIKAIGEAMSVLTADDSRDLFSKTFNSFAQIKISSRAENAVRSKVSKKLMTVARKQGSYQLAALAVSAKLDAFVKVKKAMDDMFAELKSQQKAEYEHREFCMKALDTNEDNIRDKKKLLSDTENTIADLASQIDTLTKQIEVLTVEVAETQTAIKAAGEDRAAENKEFQAVVKDQRMTVVILNKALDKLKAFYAPEQLQPAAPAQALVQKPGQANAPPPKQAKYKQSGGAPGVMGMMELIIMDAQAMESEVTKDEQKAQADYEEFVVNSNASIAASQKQIESNTVSKSKAELQKSEQEQSKGDTENILGTLGNENEALHTECDFTLKNYGIMQEARKQEMEAIEQAKAVLSGADFS